MRLGMMRVVRVVVTVVVLREELGVVSVGVLRVGVDHFVDHLASISLLRVEREHGFIKGVDSPALVDVEEGGEVVEGGCCACSGGYTGCGGWFLARGGRSGGGQTCHRVNGEGEREKEVCPRRGVGGFRWLSSEPGGV